MGEEIKTVLTADSGQLAAEFAKASEIARKYAADKEQQGARALATARASVEALRLEATGHAAAAAALREKMTIAEQARKLAAQAGLSEADSLRIVTREVELTKELAAQEAHRAQALAIANQAGKEALAIAEQRLAAEAARQKRIAELPRQGSSAFPEIPLTPENVSLNNKGQINTAKAAQQLEQLQKAGGHAGNGMMQLAYALDDAQYGMRGVENNIPAVIQGFGLGSGIAGALSLAAIGLYAYWKLARLVFKADEIDAYTEAVKKGAEAQADAWKSARREFAITLAAEQRSQDMEDFIKASNHALHERLSIQDGVLVGMERERELRQEAIDQESALRKAREGVAAAHGLPQDATEGNTAELAHMESERKSFAEQLKRAGNDAQRLLAEKLAMEDFYKSAKEGREKEIDKLRDDLTGSEANIAGYRKQLEMIKESDTRSRAQVNTGLDASTKHSDELKERIKDMEAANAAEKTIQETNSASAEQQISHLHELQEKAYEQSEALKSQIPVREQIQKLEQETLRIERTRAATDWKQQLDILKATAVQDLDRVRLLERERDIEAEKLRIMQEQGIADEAEARKKATTLVDARASASTVDARTDSSAELEILRARAAGDANRASALQRTVDMEKQILEIMRSQNVTAAEARKIAEEKIALQRNVERTDFLGEMKALQLEASGDKKGANRLREELKVRQEAVDLAQRLGISETQAQTLLREKARMEREIDERKKLGLDRERLRPRSRIYTLTPDEQRDRAGQGSRGLLPAHGLQRHEVSRRNNERSLRPPSSKDEAARTLLKSVNIQEEMLNIWKKLNTV